MGHSKWPTTNVIDWTSDPWTHEPWVNGDQIIYNILSQPSSHAKFRTNVEFRWNIKARDHHTNNYHLIRPHSIRSTTRFFYTLDWFTDYLTDRMQLVCCGESKSATRLSRCPAIKGFCSGPSAFHSLHGRYLPYQTAFDLEGHSYADNGQT